MLPPSPPLFVLLFLLSRISALTRLMSTRTTLFSTDFLAMYGLNINMKSISKQTIRHSVPLLLIIPIHE